MASSAVLLRILPHHFLHRGTEKWLLLPAWLYPSDPAPLLYVVDHLGNYCYGTATNAGKLKAMIGEFQKVQPIILPLVGNAMNG